jgi:hypothetical protein
MPRPSPLTQANIDARGRLTGLPRDASPAVDGDAEPAAVLTPAEISAVEREVEGEQSERPGITAEMRQAARGWDFSGAIGTLGIPHIEDQRRKCEAELILICINHRLTLLAERQETPGRKARALQLAPRWQRARLREQKQFWRVARNIDIGKLAKRLGEPEEAVHAALHRLGRRRWEQRPWLPQALEQEAVRVLGRIPESRADFALVRKQVLRMSRPGRYESTALQIIIQALQACAAGWNPKLIWDESRRSPPRRLLRFLTQVLDAAGIPYPDPRESYSRFISLMLMPRKPTGRQVEQAPPPRPEPSEAERRLAGTSI